MSARFQPPPTWELPIVPDADSKPIFSPIWLKWFIDLTANLGPDGTIDEASTQNILTNQAYARREPTIYSQDILKGNAQTILAGQIFGA